MFTNRTAITSTVAARVRAAIRGLASTASLAPLVSHASLEACNGRSTIAWAVEARARAAIRRLASTLSLRFIISHALGPLFASLSVTLTQSACVALRASAAVVADGGS